MDRQSGKGKSTNVHLIHDRAELGDRSLKVAEVARLLSCDESQVRKLVDAGELHGHVLGKRGIRIYLSSVEEYREAKALQPKTKEKSSSGQRRKRVSAAHNEAVANLRSLGIDV